MEPEVTELTAETLISALMESMSRTTAYRSSSTTVTPDGTATMEGAVTISDGTLAMSIHSESPQGVTQDEGSVLDVEKVGLEEVDGQPATGYVVTADTVGQMSVIEESLGDSFAEVLESMSLPPTMTTHYWTDSQNRPLKQTGTFAGLDLTMLWSGWDDPSIVVEAPPADQISDIDPFGPSDQ